MGQNGPQNVRMLMYGHIFYGYNSAIFNNRAEIYYVNCQILSVKWRWEIVILIHFKNLYFLRENRRVATMRGIGPQNSTKKLANLEDFLRQSFSRNSGFENSRPEPPPPLRICT